MTSENDINITKSMDPKHAYKALYGLIISGISHFSPFSDFIIGRWTTPLLFVMLFGSTASSNSNDLTNAKSKAFVLSKENKQ